jgi:hypothetical protein
MRWIETFGGPFIALPYRRRERWEGAEPPANGRIVRAKFRTEAGAPATDYDSACDATSAPRFFGLVRRADFVALALPRELLTWLPRPDGGVFVQWEFGESRPRVEKMLLRSLPPRGEITALPWRKTRVRFPADGGKLVVFDAAVCGREIAPARALTFTLLSGTYAVDEADFRPDEDTLMILHRLRRA